MATGEVIEVAMICLDDFVASGEPALHVINVEVEGSESGVLKGAANTLTQPSSRIDSGCAHC